MIAITSDWLACVLHQRQGSDLSQVCIFQSVVMNECDIFALEQNCARDFSKIVNFSKSHNEPSGYAVEGPYPGRGGCLYGAISKRLIFTFVPQCSSPKIASVGGLQGEGTAT